VTVPVAQRAGPIRCEAGKDANRKVAYAGTAVLAMLVSTTGASFLLEPPIASANATYLVPVETARKLIQNPRSAISNKVTDAAPHVTYNEMATLATRPVHHPIIHHPKPPGKRPQRPPAESTPATAGDVTPNNSPGSPGPQQ